MRLSGLLAEATPRAPAAVRALRWALAALLALLVAAGFAAMLVMIVIEFERAIAAPQPGHAGADWRPLALDDESMP